MAGTRVPETWPDWLRKALAARGWSQTQLGSTGVVKSDSTISKWLNGTSTPREAKTVLKIARILGQDPIAALYAAGQTEAAELAEAFRADRDHGGINALIKYELDGVEEGDPYLAEIDADAAYEAIDPDEYQRLREDYLRRKRESIRLMRRDYDEALARKSAEEPRPSNGGRRAAQ